MSQLSSAVLSVANSLLKQRKPEVLQDYASRVAQNLGARRGAVRSVFDPGSAHQFQGEGTNHCGPTTLAMVINLTFQKLGYSPSLVKFDDLQTAMQNGSLGFGFTGYRLGSTSLLQELKIAPNITGATLPWGLAQAFKDFNEGLIKAGGPDLGKAEFAEGGTREDLLDNIKRGCQTAVMVVWPDNHGAHWMAVAGFDTKTDEVHLLDPANGKGGITKMAWATFNEHWSRPIGVTNLPDLPFMDEASMTDLMTLNNVIVTFEPAAK